MVRELLLEALLKAPLSSSQAGMSEGKIPEVGALGAAEKKVRMLEQQRTEVGTREGGGSRGDPASLLGPAGQRPFPAPGSSWSQVSAMSCHGDR